MFVTKKTLKLIRIFCLSANLHISFYQPQVMLSLWLISAYIIPGYAYKKRVQSITLTKILKLKILK